MKDAVRVCVRASYARHMHRRNNMPFEHPRESELIHTVIGHLFNL